MRTLLINGYISFFSKLSMSILEYDCAKMVPIAQPFVCRWLLELIIK